MRILFVCSGNQGISPIITAQAESLKTSNTTVEIVPIIGKGILGYLCNIGTLKRAIKKSSPDLVHAHYSFCGIIAFLATRKPVVCSLMGSDVKSSGPWRMVVRFFVKHAWTATIVKSEDIKLSLGLDSLVVIPNGVDLDLFKVLDRDFCRIKLGWKKDKRYLLFAADPNRIEKNYELAKKAVALLGRSDVELKVVQDVSQSELPIFMNASDLLLLTSLWEGSPNVVKEAMACNIQIVSTEVGDVRWLFTSTQGYYIVDSDPVIVAIAISKVLENDGLGNGRERIISLQLSASAVAERIHAVYCGVVKSV